MTRFLTLSEPTSCLSYRYSKFAPPLERAAGLQTLAPNQRSGSTCDMFNFHTLLTCLSQATAERTMPMKACSMYNMFHVKILVIECKHEVGSIA